MSIGMFLRIAWKSLLYRRGAVILTIITIAVSVFTLLGNEHIRQAAKQSFNSTVSGVDLIVGPRTSEINLLLTTVFRIGNPSQNMTWQSYQSLLKNKDVDWVIPISLGDSHKGFRVVGTQSQFFTQFKYGKSRSLELSNGQPFSGLYDVVLGSQVAKQLNYSLGQKIVLSHGLSDSSFQMHDAYPFVVEGILKPTGTPVDNALYVSLAGLEAVHTPGHSADQPESLVPSSISSAMVGLKSKITTFKVQRLINDSKQEPLIAILPGVALTQLWQMSRGLESTLHLMAALMLIASLLGLGAMQLATLRERRYEFSIMRNLGASSATIFLLIQIETLCIVLLGMALGLAMLVLCIALLQQYIAAQFGIDISLQSLTMNHLMILGYILVGSILVGLVPAAIGFIRSRRV